MLDWLPDWAPDDYRLLVGMIVVVVANIVVIGGFGLLTTAAPYWIAG
jgi:hypothetical protein